MKRRKKVCPHCGRKLWLRDFYIPKSGNPSSWCKDCEKQNKRDWYDRTRRVPDGIRLNPATGLLMQHEGLARRIYWSKQMLDDLRRLFPTTKNEDMVDILGVSERTLIRKARELGIYKDKEWQHNNTMRHVKMAQLTNRIYGIKTPFQKGVHYCPENEFKKGHQLSPEAKVKHAAALRKWNRLHPKAAQHRCKSLMKPVLCVDTGETYPSIAVAARSNSVRPSWLSTRIKQGKPIGGRTYQFINNPLTKTEQ
jgi:hypothetical protein